uniref:Chalcone/stilbene synthase C-terminal domain-containing protein n=1 Tax=Oryza glaberrima TaxID=4538 RepID=I1R0M7_ORYGL
VRMPGGDLRLASLLGLRRSVQRTSMYFHGCSAAAALRVAKDLAENNPGARVLVVSAELSLTLFRAPQDGHVDTVVGQALFGDGAGAVIVGAGGDERQLPAMVRDNVEQCLAEGVGKHVAHGGWNDLFWAVHPGGRKILDVVEERLALAPGKLDASRRVLSEYGNMSGASIIFVLDELRRRGDMPPGGLGVMLGIGPGISIEMMLLRVAAA